MENEEQKDAALEAAIDRALVAGTDADVRARYLSLPAASEESCALFEDEFVICDTETTGLDFEHDQLIEIAAARVCGCKVLSRFHTFVNPGRFIPEEITELTGITNEMVADSPDPSLAVEQFADFVAGSDLVAHNAAFDKGMIMRQANPGDITGAWIDSLSIARIVLPRFKSHRAADLARAFNLEAGTHRADADVESLIKLWNVLIAGVHALPAGLARALSELSPGTDWPARKIFAQAAAADTSDFSLRRSRRARVKSSPLPDKGAAGFGDILPVFPSDEEIEHAFSIEGLAGAMYPNYEQRWEQTRMALEVAHAQRDGSYRIIEAGTGVGKSMAYLLPSALVATQNQTPIGIATKTNTLLDQLVYSELPRLKAALAEKGIPFSYIALKGYNHYPCLRKIESFIRDEREMDVRVLEMCAMLMTFATQTTWGDLDALNIHWGGLPRYAIAADSNDCLKRKCPFYSTCFLHGARNTAQKADIVVTNHSLLFRDAEARGLGDGPGLLPNINDWIVDEAHAAESEARKQFSATISAPDLNAQLYTLTSSRSGCIASIRSKAAELEGGDMLYSITADLDERCLQVKSASETFFTLVKDLAALAQDSSAYGYVTLWISPTVRGSVEFEALAEPGRILVDHLSGLIRRMRDLVSISEQFEELAVQRATLSGVICSMQNMTEALDLTLKGDDDSYVYSAELNRQADRFTESLHASKLDIGLKLSYMFYPQQNSMVFTSATLATGSKDDPFAYFKHSCGLDRLDGGEVGELQMASSYDFERNMSILLPQDMPEPTRPDYLDALEQLLFNVHTGMGGSVLTLFTNRSQMEQLYHRLKARLREQGIEVAAQTRGASVKGLRDRFIEDKNLSLFALKSFWEGFDAPGDTLRCVIIPRIPFGRPDDPLSCERNLREGRSAWSAYSLPEAVMDLKQAAGRLIRSENDSGFLVLADARLQTKSYGRVFLNAMPTHNIRKVPIGEILGLLK